MSHREIPEIKIILLGETAVGKTSIIKRFYDDEFNEFENSSITMSYVDKTIEIDNKKYKLIIWDTIGQETYRSISKLFLNETKIVILVYSIVNKASFENLTFWYNLYQEELGNEPVLGVAGNKADLFNNQEITYEEAKSFADSKGAIFAEISAKENRQTIDVFMNNLVKAYISKNKKDIKPDDTKIKLDNKKINKSNNNGCCHAGK